QRKFFRFRQGLLHSISQALGERHAILFVAVVVFARTDIAPGAVKVKVQSLGNRLAADESGDPWEIGAGNAGSIITLWVTGVIAKHRDRPILIPERKQRYLWIDHPF